MKNTILIIFCLINALKINAQCVDNGNYWNNSWMSCEMSPNPNSTHGNSLWLMYEFHEPQALDSSHIWNANREGETSTGLNEVIIEYMTDSTDNWTLLDTFNFPMANGLSSYEGFAGPNFDSLVLKKILFTVISTHEETINCASLAEVQFQTVCTNIWYEDIDGDGLGDPNSTLVDCIAPDNYVYNNVDTCDLMSWTDIYTIFKDSKCTSCHGTAGGLDLSTYDDFIQGGNSCNLLGGSTLVDIINTGSSCNMSSFDAMNSYTSTPITDEQLARIQLWINDGAKENCSDYCSEPEVAYNGIDDDCDPTTLDDDLDQDGFVLADDCDDNDSAINPDQSELVYNGIDDDCDPMTLDDDLDQDGFVLAEDCDDTDALINTAQTEIVYNGIDDDCNEDTLDDDLDQDGFVLAEDCDDNDSQVNSNQTEIPYNGLDDDCDPNTLDDDLDQDGFNIADDCDDTNADVNSDIDEIVYNGIDDDCDPMTLDDDIDQDGFDFADDCDDDNPSINPDAEEIANNDIDEDCDGMDLLTSIHELSNARINIYPNPVKDVINIEVSGSLNYRISIYSLNGKLVKSFENMVLINVNSLVTGTYLLEIEDLKNGQRVVEKIIVGR